MLAQTSSGLYVPIQKPVEPKPIRIAIGCIPDHHISPLTVIRKHDCTLLVEHEGTSAEDMIPAFIEQLYIPEFTALAALWTPRPVEAILTDWRRELADLLHVRALHENIPPGAHWNA